MRHIDGDIAETFAPAQIAELLEAADKLAREGGTVTVMPLAPPT